MFDVDVLIYKLLEGVKAVSIRNESKKYVNHYKKVFEWW